MQSSDATADFCTALTHKLKRLPTAQSGYTIYKVHRHLRDVNYKAYEPETIAIGPYHRDRYHLKMVEEHKLRYLRILVQRNEENDVERYVSAIRQLEKEARNCYAEPIPLSPEELIEMLVLDGCFVIELVRKFYNPSLREENDPIFNMKRILIGLKRDLMLFENQIPFFILCKLFDLINEAPNRHNDFMYQVLCFFDSLYPGKVARQSLNRSPHKIKHLLDLIHNNWLPSFDFLNMKQGTKEGFQVIDNASALREANVKFKKNKSADATLFDVCFKNGTLLLPPLKIDDHTESLFRNLIAYEQYFNDYQFSFVTDYATFMDFLIDSSKDVEILSSRELSVIGKAMIKWWHTCSTNSWIRSRVPNIFCMVNYSTM